MLFAVVHDLENKPINTALHHFYYHSDNEIEDSASGSKVRKYEVGPSEKRDYSKVHENENEGKLPDHPISDHQKQINHIVVLLFLGIQIRLFDALQHVPIRERRIQKPNQDADQNIPYDPDEQPTHVVHHIRRDVPRIQSILEF